MKPSPENIKLVLDNGKTISGYKIGEGPLPFIICGGPATFYLEKFPDEIRKQMSIYAFDQWAKQKDEPESPKDVEGVTFDSWVDEQVLTIKALKAKYQYKKIGIIGISAPGLEAMETSLRLSPDEVLVATFVGVPLYKLSKDFLESINYFNQSASPKRQRKKKQLDDNFQLLKDGNENGKPLKNSNYRDRRLSQGSFFAEWARTIAPTQIGKDYEDDKLAEEFAEMWRKNLAGQVINTVKREHYFNVLEKIDVNSILEKLATKKIPVLIIFGEKDYTTVPIKIALDALSKYENFICLTYTEAGHMPFWEKPKEFITAVVNSCKDFSGYRQSILSASDSGESKQSLEDSNVKTLELKLG